ncbi:hypothetical protein [Alkaliphilus peptidifermentans]|uniref:Uncharacterized protein n=1 Tax=Alkaliphilus peptidifermentans DSM 18978 TaxID=1120976 RepID=A0A1G5EYJ6_9FIRM|nr:hypothetical protein [Alkaliphilus peptidifermentans]SCY32047.1 hypothetical protein SAMN03080606_01271 [Alkaliphilus peptidifermentans DSM 18978]
MIIVLLLIALFLLFLVDLPILYNSKNKLALAVYSFLMIIGILIVLIVAEDLAIPSPAIHIEKIVNNLRGN